MVNPFCRQFEGSLVDQSYTIMHRSLSLYSVNIFIRFLRRLFSRAARCCLLVATAAAGATVLSCSQSSIVVVECELNSVHIWQTKGERGCFYLPFYCRSQLLPIVQCTFRTSNMFRRDNSPASSSFLSSVNCLPCGPFSC